MGLTRQRSRTLDGHSWYKTVLICATTFCWLSLVLQFVGFVTPGWIVLTAPAGITVSAGIWYLQVCKETVDVSRECRTASMTRVGNPFNIAGDSHEEFVDMLELQVETTLSFVVCISAAILVTYATANKSKAPKHYLIWSAAACIVSAGLLLVPVSRLLHIVRHWDSYIVYELPYSIVASGIGILAALVTAGLNCIAICMIRIDLRNERRAHSEEHADLTLHV